MGTLNFSVKRGETFDRTFTWWTTRDVTARDLTGYAFKLQIRTEPGVAAVAELELGSGITLVDADAGVFRVVISAEDTAAWTFDQARYDLRATDAGSLVSYPLEGHIFATDPVTT